MMCTPSAFNGNHVMFSRVQQFNCPFYSPNILSFCICICPYVRSFSMIFACCFFFLRNSAKFHIFFGCFFLLAGITRCFPINWLGFGYVYFIPHIILSSTRHWLVVRVTNRRYWRGWPGAYIYIYMHICTSVAIRYTHSHTPFRQWPQSDTRKPCAINQAHKNRAVAIVRSEK